MPPHSPPQADRNSASLRMGCFVFHEIEMLPFEGHYQPRAWHTITLSYREAPWVSRS